MHLKKACTRSQLEEMQAFVGKIDSFDPEEAKPDEKKTILEGVEFYINATLKSKILQNYELFSEKSKEEWETALENEIRKFTINRNQVKDEVEYKFKVYESTSGEGKFVKKRYFRSRVKNSE